MASLTRLIFNGSEPGDCMSIWFTYESREWCISTFTEWSPLTGCAGMFLHKGALDRVRREGGRSPVSPTRQGGFPGKWMDRTRASCRERQPIAGNGHLVRPGYENRKMWAWWCCSGCPGNDRQRRRDTNPPKTKQPIATTSRTHHL